ncbi:3,4-dihydroxy-2-butanone-4-phosphate synthase [Sphingobium sp.]|uniref:3,4-dihydroxy-2-butanone-4-phosphate synthase n=1 Tax=Sphingobium sp. TaxID=1912891 RepID=UPI0026292D75|nr:3,4-dihydroxy-2-butanone-4-phosphate synthase [Sphingobium sp.]
MGADHEGDLILPAQMVTPEAVNFMARHCRGLICLAMTQARVDELGLPAMTGREGRAGPLAFTLSIEARHGVTTGISAGDRARTIQVAIDPAQERDAIVSPGHVFPLVAHPGGVLMRAGRTEGAVDIARLAGLNPSGVICRILRADGQVARLDDLRRFARDHDIRIGTIRDLIAYRRRHDYLVEREAERDIVVGDGGVWRAMTYRNRIDNVRHDVLVKGHIGAGEPTLVRMHWLSLFDDVLGCAGPRSRLLQQSMAEIDAAGRGVIVLFQPFVEPRFAYGRQSVASGDMDLRSYGLGAQILADLGVDQMILLTNARSNMVAIDGWGMQIVEERAFA